MSWIRTPLKVLKQEAAFNTLKAHLDDPEMIDLSESTRPDYLFDPYHPHYQTDEFMSIQADRAGQEHLDVLSTGRFFSSTAR